jgi:hypothetical protein
MLVRRGKQKIMCFWATILGPATAGCSYSSEYSVPASSLSHPERARVIWNETSVSFLPPRELTKECKRQVIALSKGLRHALAAGVQVEIPLGPSEVVYYGQSWKAFDGHVPSQLTDKLIVSTRMATEVVRLLGSVSLPTSNNHAAAVGGASALLIIMPALAIGLAIPTHFASPGQTASAIDQASAYNYFLRSKNDACFDDFLAY